MLLGIAAIKNKDCPLNILQKNKTSALLRDFWIKLRMRWVQFIKRRSSHLVAIFLWGGDLIKPFSPGRGAIVLIIDTAYSQVNF